MTKPERTYTPEDAARAAGFSMHAVYMAMKAGRLKASHSSLRRYEITARDLVAWLESLSTLKGPQ